MTMESILSVGDRVKIRKLPDPDFDPHTLRPCPSTYGLNIVFSPNKDDIYVIKEVFSAKNYIVFYLDHEYLAADRSYDLYPHDKTYIGFELIVNDIGSYVRVSQIGHKMEPVEIEILI